MKYLHKFRAMPLFRKSKRRCRLDHYLIAAPSNPVYRIVFLTKFRSSLVRRRNKQTRGSAASEDLPARRGPVPNWLGKAMRFPHLSIPFGAAAPGPHTPNTGGTAGWEKR